MAFSTLHGVFYDPSVGAPKKLSFSGSGQTSSTPSVPTIMPQAAQPTQPKPAMTGPVYHGESSTVNPDYGIYSNQKMGNMFSGQNLLGGPGSHIGQLPQPGSVGTGTPYSGGYTPSSPWSPSPGTLNPSPTTGTPWSAAPPTPQAPRPQPTPGPAPGTVSPSPGGIPDLSGDFIKGFARGTRPELAGEAFEGIGKYDKGEYQEGRFGAGSGGYGPGARYQEGRFGAGSGGYGPGARVSGQKEIEAAWNAYDRGESDQNEFYNIFNKVNKNVYDKETGAYNDYQEKLKTMSPSDRWRAENILENILPNQYSFSEY